MKAATGIQSSLAPRSSKSHKAASHGRIFLVLNILFDYDRTMQSGAQYAWFDAGNGRQVFRRIPARVVGRSSLPCPMVITDAIEPTQSMADGQFYTSKTALRRTYRADGNPQGVDYVEVGNDQRPHEQKRGNIVRNKAKSTEAIQKAMATADRGEGTQA